MRIRKGDLIVFRHDTLSVYRVIRIIIDKEDGILYDVEKLDNSSTRFRDVSPKEILKLQ